MMLYKSPTDVHPFFFAGFFYGLTSETTKAKRQNVRIRFLVAKIS